MQGVIGDSDITAVLPHGSDPTSLIASYSTTGRSVHVKGVEQESGVTANDFSMPLSYLVTAEDGGTREYMVTVSVAKSDAKSITSFRLDGEPAQLTKPPAASGSTCRGERTSEGL